jgi:hypothetical protein
VEPVGLVPVVNRTVPPDWLQTLLDWHTAVAPVPAPDCTANVTDPVPVQIGPFTMPVKVGATRGAPPRFASAVAAVVAPVPPLAIPTVPVTAGAVYAPAPFR